MGTTNEELLTLGHINKKALDQYQQFTVWRRMFKRPRPCLKRQELSASNYVYTSLRQPRGASHSEHSLTPSAISSGLTINSVRVSD
jgi:hypothetical protein